MKLGRGWGPYRHSCPGAVARGRLASVSWGDADAVALEADRGARAIEAGLATTHVRQLELLCENPGEFVFDDPLMTEHNPAQRLAAGYSPQACSSVGLRQSSPLGK